MRRNPSRKPQRTDREIPPPAYALIAAWSSINSARHDLVLLADPPESGTLIRIVGVAEDRCGRGAQTGRSSVLALQVVSPDELFYEILIRQRGERAKFVALLESCRTSWVRSWTVPARRAPRIWSAWRGSNTPARARSTRSPAAWPIRSRK